VFTSILIHNDLPLRVANTCFMFPLPDKSVRNLAEADCSSLELLLEQLYTMPSEKTSEAGVPSETLTKISRTLVESPAFLQHNHSYLVEQGDLHGR